MIGVLRKRAHVAWAVLVLSGLTLSPALALGADHRDSPLIKLNGLLDINDVYVFQSPANAGNTVIAVTVVPLAGVFNQAVFSSLGVYDINIDNTGDAIEDVNF